MTQHQHQRRRNHSRRVADHYTTIVQRVIMATSAVGVIYGQAEMLGEPWRHIVAVGGVLILVSVAVWMKVT